ncbi:MAG: hypothetical protein RSB67_01105 [Clostridia bacterium]
MCNKEGENKMCGCGNSDMKCCQNSCYRPQEFSCKCKIECKCSKMIEQCPKKECCYKKCGCN